MLLLPWLIAYTRRGDLSQRDAAQETSDEAKLERASSAYCHTRGVKVAALNLLAEPRSAENENTWNTLVAKFLRRVRGGGCCSPASVTDVENGKSPLWHPDDEYTSEVLFDVTCSRSALSGPGNDGLRFFHLQSTIHTDIGKEESGRGMTAFRRRIVDEPHALPPEFWRLFLQSSLSALGEKCRPVCVGMIWRRLITAGAMRQ